MKSFILALGLLFSPLAFADLIMINVNKAIRDDNLNRYNISKIKNATENDAIYMYIATPGGAVNVMMDYVHALKATKARITMYVNYAYSAGAAIMCAANTHKTTELHYEAHSTFLVHLGRYYIQSPYKWVAVKVPSSAFDEYLDVIQEGCPGMLTTGDVNAYLDGEDVVITGYQWDKNKSITKDNFDVAREIYSKTKNFVEKRVNEAKVLGHNAIHDLITGIGGLLYKVLG